MKITELSPKIRFADKLEYTASRSVSKTYDSRLIYVTSGEGYFTLEGTRHKVSQGTLIAFQGGTGYKYLPSPSFTAYAIDFDSVDGYETDSGFILPVDARLFDESLLHKVVYFEDSDFLSRPFIECVGVRIGDEVRRVVEEFGRGGRFCKERAEHFLFCLLLELAGRYYVPSKVERCVEAVVEYISAHYRDDLTNNALAKNFGYDPCYLGRAVRLHTGSTIHSLLLKKRVEEGIKLLLTTDMNLDVIAERVGFCSAAHFSKSCKKITGNSPSDYRKKY